MYGKRVERLIIAVESVMLVIGFIVLFGTGLFSVEAPGLTAQTVEPLSVLSFGATPDDNTEDTVSIQNALDAGCAQGRPVFAPAGVYRVGALKVCDNLIFYGASEYGTILSSVQTMFSGQAPNSQLYNHMLTPRNAANHDYVTRNVVLRDLKLLGNSAIQFEGQPSRVSQHGVGLIGAQGWLIERVWAEDFDGDGFYLGRSDGGLPPAFENQLVDCVARRNMRNGISITAGRDNLVRGCLVELNQRGQNEQQAGSKYAPSQYRAGDVDLEPNNPNQRVTGNLFIDNIIRNSYWDCVVLTRPNTTISENVFSGNQIYGCARLSVATFASSANGNYFEDNIITAGGSSVFSFVNGDNNCIRRNVVTGSLAAGQVFVLNAADNEAAQGNAFVANDIRQVAGSPYFVLERLRGQNYAFGNLGVSLPLVTEEPSFCAADGNAVPGASVPPTQPPPTPVPPTQSPPTPVPAPAGLEICIFRQCYTLSGRVEIE